MANATISTVDNSLPLLFRSRVEVNVEGAQIMTARGRSGPSGAGNGPLARIVCEIRRNSAMLRKANNHDCSKPICRQAGSLLLGSELPASFFELEGMHSWNAIKRRVTSFRSRPN